MKNQMKTVSGNQNNQPTEGLIQNHTENQSGKSKSGADPTYVNFIVATCDLTEGVH